MEATGTSIRYRANVTRNSKGYSVDWTVERIFSEGEMSKSYAFDNDQRQEEVLTELKSFGKKLEAAYPATVDAGKPEKVAVNGAS